MKNLLFINACVNREASRTYRLAKELVSLLKDNFEVAELVLENESIQPLNSGTLNKRLDLSKKGAFSDEIFSHANQFKNADCIVIAAPFWDLGFPAMLKAYIEAVSVAGLLYKFGEDCKSVGFCRAEKIYYVTTRGGFTGDGQDLGLATVKALGELYGIPEVRCISASGFDIPVTDIEAVITQLIENLPNVI